MSEPDRFPLDVDAPDPDALPTATIGVAGVLVLIIVVVLVQGLYERVNRAQIEKKVVAVQPAEIRDLRAAQSAKLHETAWVDEKNGYVSIPIERAMKQMVADPNPAAPIILPPESSTAGKP